ncbi:helix-turn-helix transcriptional regulator [Rhizobium lentis]|uniref:helix-turn-helix transcriptional regulator n=1 Tax=Rhizobium lentis TaxID=1138194 RepID=UPI001C83F38C|nr:helix-turn-helix domain-containing protein [Rhizobium lentis]MBX5144954.1 helix-turn-helix domain-containing protein [Rhizobium lentis]
MLIAINSYRDLFSAHNALPENADDETVEASGELLKAANDVLALWRSPATSHEAALAAVSLAEREKAIFEESPVADAMEAAAIGYWKNAGDSHLAPKAAVDASTRIGLKDLSPDMCLTGPEAAAYLRISDATLARWRSTRRGPIYFKAGGRVLYRVSALLDYVAKNERNGTRPEK